MKFIKLSVSLLFSLMILLPLAGFQFGEGIVSEIDNRKLQENPFRPEERAKKKSIQELIALYVSDRIGFRSNMILAYTILNDKLFGEMVHPSYRYGKNGYVFPRRLWTPVYGKYHETFADMIKMIQDYCEERKTSFLFVFEPQKNDILPQYLPNGVHYDNRWVVEFIQALDARGIHYIDNTVILQKKTEEGNAVFNQKYDALHWNDIGRFYGVNAILAELHKNFPGIRQNIIDDFEQTEIIRTSLQVSRFPICEYVPVIKVPMNNIEDIADKYTMELERHRKHRDFGYTYNYLHLQDTPRTLFFQGSHLNGHNSDLLSYALGEYIYIHNYQNVIDFPYYYNIFHPKCVVFEVAEYTLLFTDRNNSRFDEKKMDLLHFNPLLKTFAREKGIPMEHILVDDEIDVQKGNVLTKIVWTRKTEGIEYAWCLLDEEFDMRKHKGGGYEVTVNNAVYEAHKGEMKIVTMENGKLHIYKT